METFAPRADKAVTTDESFASEPLTLIPCESAIRASPLIPAPPIPMKWIRFPIKDDSCGFMISGQTRLMRRSFQQQEDLVDLLGLEHVRLSAVALEDERKCNQR